MKSQLQNAIEFIEELGTPGLMAPGPTMAPLFGNPFPNALDMLSTNPPPSDGVGELKLSFSPTMVEAPTNTVVTTKDAAVENLAPGIVFFSNNVSAWNWSRQFATWCDSENLNAMTTFFKESHIKYLLHIQWDHPSIQRNREVFEMALDAKIVQIANFQPNGDLRAAINQESDLEFLSDFLVKVAKQRVISGKIPELEKISRKMANNGRWATARIPLEKSAGYYTRMIFGVQNTRWLEDMYSNSSLLCCRLGPIFGKIPEHKWKKVWCILNFKPSFRKVNSEMVYTMSNYMKTDDLFKWFDNSKIIIPCKHDNQLLHPAEGVGRLRCGRFENEFDNRLKAMVQRMQDGFIESQREKNRTKNAKKQSAKRKRK